MNSPLVLVLAIHVPSLLGMTAGPALAQGPPVIALNERCQAAPLPDTIAVAQAQTTSVSISPTVRGMLGRMTLSVSSAVRGVSGSVTPDTIVRGRGGSMMLNIFIDGDAAPGKHPLILRCETDDADDTRQGSVTLMITVEERPATIRWAAVATGHMHSCALDENGSAYCWGYNFSGELGDGTSTAKGMKTTPVRVQGSHRFSALSLSTHTCGVTMDRQLYCWGRGHQGQLGTGRKVSSATMPLPVAGGLTWRSVSAGSQHSCGIATSEEAYCWGNNFSGALGNGRTSASIVPSLVVGGHRWAMIGSGHHFTCGVTTTGEMYCWGANSYGQLGIGGTTNQSIPMRIQGNQRWASVSVRGTHACGLTTDGQAYCWGRNNAGQLGIGGTADQNGPRLVAGGHRWSHISVGQDYTCGITAAQQAYCWGPRGMAIGNMNASASETTQPVPVDGGFNWTTLSAGGHTCGTTTSGAAYCWGGNSSGQLGGGSQRSFPLPVWVRDPSQLD